MNLILNSFPRTIGILLGKQELLNILRCFQKSGNVPLAAAGMGRRAGVAPLERLMDVALFEHLSAVAPGRAARRKTYKLLETSYDPYGLSEKRQKNKRRYLFFYHGGSIDTFEIISSNFRRFREAARVGGDLEREAMLEIEKYI